MKQHLFNSLTISCISLDKKESEMVRGIFFDIVEDCGFECTNVYKPAKGDNMRLNGGDEEDFKQVLELTREAYSLARFNNYIQGVR